MRIDIQADNKANCTCAKALKLIVFMLMALGLAACGSSSEEKLISYGIGTNLYSADIKDQTENLGTYFSYLCPQAGLDVRDDGTCDMGTYGNASWTLLIRAGFNDIDRRCDSYLAWINSRRRNQKAFLRQLTDTRNFAEAILNIAGASSNPITRVGLAFGIVGSTYQNYYSRLIFEIEKSTIEVLVHEKRLKFRESISKSRNSIQFLPDAVYVLRQYLLICTPHYIENKINQRTRDSISGHTPVDRNDPDQIVANLISNTFRQQVPQGGARGRLGNVAGQPGEPDGNPTKINGGITAIEKNMDIEFGTKIQGNLCVEPQSGNFATITRQAIRLAKAGAPGQFTNSSDKIENAAEAQKFKDLKLCSLDQDGVDRGYKNAFEKLRFPNKLSIEAFQKRLKMCDERANKGVPSSVKATGEFDPATRKAIELLKAKLNKTSGFEFLNTDQLSPNSARELIKAPCNVKRS